MMKTESTENRKIMLDEILVLFKSGVMLFSPRFWRALGPVPLCLPAAEGIRGLEELKSTIHNGKFQKLSFSA